MKKKEEGEEEEKEGEKGKKKKKKIGTSILLTSPGQSPLQD